MVGTAPRAVRHSGTDAPWVRPYQCIRKMAVTDVSWKRPNRIASDFHMGGRFFLNRFTFLLFMQKRVNAMFLQCRK